MKPLKFVRNMDLSLSQLVPLPLREKVARRESGIWMRDVVFTQGEYVFVKAPSGTGKTTLVHILYGLRNDYEGVVKCDGTLMQNINPETLANFRRDTLSVIFQDMRLFPELTAWENLDIKRFIANTVGAEEVTEWLDRLGMADKRNSLAGTLSYGEQQRIAIIRALVQPFRWLLMDEPFSHLDEANTAKAAALIAEVVQQNKAGMLLADLDDNTFFPYTKTITL